MATIYCGASVSEIHGEDLELIEQLAKLQNMYNQIFKLRTLLPERLISPIKQAVATHHGSSLGITPAVLAAQLRKVAVQGTQEVKSFRKNWDSDGFRVIRENASSAVYPQGDDSWRTDYEMLTRQPDKYTTGPSSEAQKDELETNAEVENASEVIKSFQQAHPEMRVAIPQSQSDFLLDLRIGTTTFRVYELQSEGKAEFYVSVRPGKEPSELAKQILQSLQTRRPERKLSVSLSLLASHVMNVIKSMIPKCNFRSAKEVKAMAKVANPLGCRFIEDVYEYPEPRHLVKGWK